jgi:hypothetical protein
VSVRDGPIVLKPCVVILEDNPARIELMKPVLAEVLPQFEHLACKPSVCPVIVHTANTNAGWSMLYPMRHADWIVSRVYPSDGTNWILTDWASDIRAYVRRGLIF